MSEKMVNAYQLYNNALKKQKRENYRKKGKEAAETIL